MKPSRKMLIPGIVEFAPMSSVRNTLTFTDGVRHRHDTVHGRLAVEAADEVGEVVEDGEIVLDGDNVAVGRQEAADDFGGLETLLDIQVT